MCCLHTRSALALTPAASGHVHQSGQHKFAADSQMSFQEVFNFSYGSLTSMLENLRNEFPDSDFIAALRRAGSRGGEQYGRDMAAGVPQADLRTFTQWAREPDRFWQHVLTFEVIEDVENALEVKVTECLWARTFRSNDAADIGYALVCHPDFTICRGFNPKIRMERTKTLMQGHDCCNHRWILEA